MVVVVGDNIVHEDILNEGSTATWSRASIVVRGVHATCALKMTCTKLYTRLNMTCTLEHACTVYSVDPNVKLKFSNSNFDVSKILNYCTCVNNRQLYTTVIYTTA